MNKSNSSMRFCLDTWAKYQLHNSRGYLIKMRQNCLDHLHLHYIVYPITCFFVSRSNLLGKTPEEAIIVEAGSDEKAELVGALPSLCLKQVFPKYMKQFNYLRILERIADIFLRFLGVKGTMKLGPTSFRTFIRQDWSIKT